MYICIAAKFKKSISNYVIKVNQTLLINYVEFSTSNFLIEKKNYQDNSNSRLKQNTWSLLSGYGRYYMGFLYPIKHESSSFFILDNAVIEKKNICMSFHARIIRTQSSNRDPTFKVSILLAHFKKSSLAKSSSHTLLTTRQLACGLVLPFV